MVIKSLSVQDSQLRLKVHASGTAEHASLLSCCYYKFQSSFDITLLCLVMSKIDDIVGAL